MTAPDPSPPASPPSTESPSESRTRIIRRAPTGPIPTAPESPTTHIPPQPAGSAAPGIPAAEEPSGRTAVAACAVSIVSGWATSVVATDLIAGWWRTDRLFCIAVAFLALVFAASTIAGVILLLQRRPIGRWLLLIGAVVGFLTYLGIFIADARVAWIVQLLPVLPIATAILVLLPATRRWLQG